MLKATRQIRKTQIILKSFFICINLLLYLMTAKMKISKKEARRGIFFSVFLGVLTLGLIGFLLVSDIRINKKRSELLKEIDRLSWEIQKTENQNAQLETGILKAASESHWEEKIREQGYQKPGEQPVVVLPPKENQTEKTASTKNFWQKLLEKIGF